MPHCKKQMISFFLTTRCNLNCIYCYNVEERKKLIEKTLPLHIAKAGIDRFFSENSSRHIRFYGPGEPTQEFNTMQSITDYAKSIDQSVTVEIQTNGVFSHSVRDWVLENANIVWMSFDGPPDIQNHNRPIGGSHPSAPIIEENVRWLNANKKGRRLMVGARVTMTELNITRQIEMVDYFYNLGIRYVWTNPLFPSVGTTPFCDDEDRVAQYAFDMDTYLDNFIPAHHYAMKKGMFYGSFLLCNFDGETHVHCRACSPVPHLTPDGYVSACDMVVFGEDAHHMDCFIYGKWDERNGNFILSQDKIDALKNRNIDNLEHCLECKARLNCGGYCLGEVVNETGKLTGQKQLTCRAIRRLFDEIGPFKEPFEYLHP